MPDNEINLAALWVPVMADTHQIGRQLREAGTQGRREFTRAFTGGGSSSGLFGNLGNELSQQLRTGLTMGLSGLSPGIGALTQGLISGFDGVKGRTAQAEYALQSYTRAQDRLTQATARSAIAQQRLNELQGKGVAENTAQMMTASANLASANSKVARAAEEVAAAENLKQVATKNSLASSMGFVAATGVVASFGAAVFETTKKAGNFEASMTRLAASAGESTDNLKAVGEGILQLAGQVGYSAQDLSNSMYMVEKAGYRGAEGVNVLKAAAQGAKSENSELKEVLNGLTTSMNDFGYTSDQAADVMSKMVAATSLAKTNFQDFSGSLHSAEPLIANIGKSQGLTSDQMHHLMADLYGLGAQMTQTGDSAQHSFELIGHAASKLLGPTAAMRSMMGSLGLDAQDVTDHLGERGVAGTLQILQGAVQAHTKDGMVDIDVHYQSAQAARAEAEAFSALPGPAKAVAQQIKDGTLSYQEFRKSRGGLNREMAGQVNQWDALNSKVTGFNDLIKSGIGDHISYDQALKILTGDQETLQVALQASGDNTGAVNDKIKQVDQTTREHDGTVKGFTETQQTFNAKMADAKAAFGAAAIELGTAFLPEMTHLANALADIGRFLAENKGLTEGLTFTVGGLATAYLGLRGALGFKHLIDDIRTSFFGVNTAAATANTTMSEAGTAAATGAAGVEGAAAREVAAEEDVAAAAVEADAALAGGVGGKGGRLANTVKRGARALPYVGAAMAADDALGIDEHTYDPSDQGWGHALLGKSWDWITGRAGGGPIFGSGPKGKDSVPAWLAPGEHVLTAHDVDAMGGHSGVYALRNAIHRADGGEVPGGGGDPVSNLYREAETLNGGSYRWGSTDCSGAVSMLVNSALGTSGRMSTITAAGWLAAKGFQPGMGPPGSLSIGWYNGGPGGGHMAATLPDGSHFESGGQHGGIMLGGSAAGAENSEFTSHMYLPMEGLYPDGVGSSGGGMGTGASGGMGGFGAGGVPAGGRAGMGPGGQSGYYMANPQKTAHAQEELRHLDAEIADAEKRKSELKADAKQSERDRLDETIRHLHVERDEAAARLGKAEQGDFHGMSGSGSGRGGKGSREGGGGANGAAESFGGSFLKGLLGDFGFGNVLGGKSPLDWGIVKLAEGIGQYGMGLGQQIMAARGMGGGGGTGGLPGIPGMSGMGMGSAGGAAMGASGGPMADVLGGDTGGGQMESGGGNGAGAKAAAALEKALPLAKMAMGYAGSPGTPGGRLGDLGTPTGAGMSGGPGGIRTQEQYRMFQAGVLDVNGNPTRALSPDEQRIMQGGGPVNLNGSLPNAPWSSFGTGVTPDPNSLLTGGPGGPSGPWQPPVMGPSSIKPPTGPSSSMTPNALTPPMLPRYAAGGIVGYADGGTVPNPPRDDKRGGPLPGGGPGGNLPSNGRDGSWPDWWRKSINDHFDDIPEWMPQWGMNGPNDPAIIGGPDMHPSHLRGKNGVGGYATGGPVPDAGGQMYIPDPDHAKSWFANPYTNKLPTDASDDSGVWQRMWGKSFGSAPSYGDLIGGPAWQNYFQDAPNGKDEQRWKGFYKNDPGINQWKQPWDGGQGVYNIPGGGLGSHPPEWGGLHAATGGPVPRADVPGIDNNPVAPGAQESPQTKYPGAPSTDWLPQFTKPGVGVPGGPGPGFNQGSDAGAMPSWWLDIIEHGGPSGGHLKAPGWWLGSTWGWQPNDPGSSDPSRAPWKYRAGGGMMPKSTEEWDPNTYLNQNYGTGMSTPGSYSTIGSGPQFPLRNATGGLIPGGGYFSAGGEEWDPSEWMEHNYLPHFMPPWDGKLENLGPKSTIHNATGGPIGFPGGPSGTDTIPAWLSPGEFVIKSSAVQKYGSSFMSSVNAGKFATGGMVPLAPSSVGSAPTSVSVHDGNSVAHHGPVTYDNRTIISGNSLADPYQLAAPIQEINNSKVYSRSQWGGLPIATGPGGG